MLMRARSSALVWDHSETCRLNMNRKPVKKQFTLIAEPVSLSTYPSRKQMMGSNELQDEWEWPQTAQPREKSRVIYV
ncbi:hypothetical protein PsorP6_004982 [Peronosclerospora sorghi]|uniref:Uncharacterized protein n=1 Tax=Peronosclerospora sorghi TaxID=230839 RepID=A0ACC0W581_9STRA|nr:hypothetical protein PsorP6_004982 [Peronosclerospora sorghi]